MFVELRKIPYDVMRRVVSYKWGGYFGYLLERKYRYRPYAII